MLWYVARRLAGTAVLLAVIATLTLLLVRLAPGDAAVTLAGSGATPESVARLRDRLQLDRPVPYQVSAYLSALARGDLGFSVLQGRPVAEGFAPRCPGCLCGAGACHSPGRPPGRPTTP